MTRRILIVEDDLAIAEVVRETLGGLGRPISHVAGGAEALNELAKADVDLVILDLNINGLSGMEVCRHTRKYGSHVPILILTSQHEEIDKILALELGADDYLTKPFSVRELLARVHALLRRSELSQTASVKSADHTVRIGDLSINMDRCTVHRGSESLPITCTEFQLLAVLATHPGRTYTREELGSAAFGTDSENVLGAITAHLCRMREKLEPNKSKPKYLITVRGVGYRLAAPDECD